MVPDGRSALANNGPRREEKRDPSGARMWLAGFTELSPAGQRTLDHTFMLRPMAKHACVLVLDPIARENVNFH